MNDREKSLSSGRDAGFWVSLLFAFLLSLALVLLAAALILRLTLSAGSLRKITASETYTDIVLAEVERSAHDYTLATDISPTVLEDVFSPEEIRHDVSETITAAFAAQTHVPDTAALKARLSARVSSFYAKRDDPPAQLEAIVAAYADDIAEIYTNSVKIIGIRYVTEAAARYARYFPLILGAALVLAGLLAVLCLRLQRRAGDGLRILAYAAGGAALSLFAAPFAVYISQVYTRISIHYQALYYLLTAYFAHVLRLFFLAAALLLAVTVVLAAAAARSKKRPAVQESAAGAP